jgi:hypothetical protein
MTSGDCGNLELTYSLFMARGWGIILASGWGITLVPISPKVGIYHGPRHAEVYEVGLSVLLRIILIFQVLLNIALSSPIILRHYYQSQV